MPILKCKMCGGDLNILEGMTVCECEYCNTKQTVPTIDDDKKVALFTRANKLRAACEFDKAYGVYESIVVDYPDEAEAYWGLILCKYGIEYVDDPATSKKIPTCHRSSFESVMDDANFELVLENSEAISRAVYREEAKAIEELRKGIIEVSSKEEPYDIFICYKETDLNGDRTLDSVIAQDVYKELTNEGYRVFFSRITLEDKLGQEYEPYIFAALHSAKVMLVFGTDYEYFNAVWVKNEWSRYLQLIAQGEKKTLIPCYKGIDAYDMPKEFAKLQAQDLGKVGATQDLIRGIEKILPKKTEVVKETVVVQSGNGTSVDKMLERGQLALEDNDWQKADSFFEEALNQNPKCAEAYLGKLLAESKCVTFEDYKVSLINKYEDATTEKIFACDEDTEHIESVVKENVLEGYLYSNQIRNLYAFDRAYSSSLACRKEQKKKQQSEIDGDKLLTRVRQYASGELSKQIESGIENLISIHDVRIAEAQKSDEAKITEITANYQSHIVSVDEKACDLRVAAEKKKYSVYESYVKEMTNARTENDYSIVRDKFLALGNYKSASEKAQKCQSVIDRIKDEERKEKERLVRRVKNTTIISVIAILAVIAVITIVKVVIPTNNYNKAIALKNNGQYSEAIIIFENLNGYKDSESQILDCNYNFAISMIESGRYQEAASVFESLNEYKDSYNQMLDCNYYLAIGLMNNGQYSEAIAAFENLNGYQESESLIFTCELQKISSLNVGDTFTYGIYNGEALEWTILDIQNNQVLVIATDVICERSYNDAHRDVTWQICNLRIWLNDYFYNEAFSSIEQSRIMLTTLSPGSNPNYSTTGGMATEDKVFLLSIDEVNQYFSSNSSRVCEYNGGACWWWLRSPGHVQYNAADVGFDGSVGCYGNNVADDTGAVRPAMWITLSSEV